MAPDPRRQALLLLALAVVFGAVFVGGAVYVLSQQRTGEQVDVTVTECQTGRRSIACYGTWTDGGTVRTGIVENATTDQVGQTLEARSSGERAYLPSLRLPIILLVLGLALPVGAMWEAARTRRTTGSRVEEPAR